MIGLLCWTSLGFGQELERLQVGLAVERAVAVDAARQLSTGAVRRAELQWLPRDGALRRTWVVDLEGTPWGPLEPRVLVDGDSGEPLIAWDNAVHARAAAFVPNPVDDPIPTVVELTTADEGLADLDVVAFQCRDLGEVTTVEIDGEIVSYRTCTEVPAAGPVDGRYRASPVPWSPDPGRDEDDFVAHNVFHHVHRGLAWADSLDWAPTQGLPPIEVVVNYRVTDTLDEVSMEDPASALRPYNNAYAQRGEPPRMVFGQGTDVDFGYDAQVVGHELGHVLVDRSGGLGVYHYGDRDQMLLDAGALNEGIADYVAAAMFDRDRSRSYRVDSRSLVGDANCWQDRLGQVHVDSQPFSQGLWTVRSELDPVRRPRLDAAVLASLGDLSSSSTFLEAVEVISVRVAGEVGRDEANRLRQEWARRGVLDCATVREVAVGPDPFVDYVDLPFIGTDPQPGLLQYTVDVPVAGETYVFEVTRSEFLGLELGGSNELAPVRIVGDFKKWVQPRMSLEGMRLGTLETVRRVPNPASPDRYLLHVQRLYWQPKKTGTFRFQFENAGSSSTILWDPKVHLYGEDQRTYLRGCATVGPSPTGGVGWTLLLGLVLRRRSRSGPCFQVIT